MLRMNHLARPITRHLIKPITNLFVNLSVNRYRPLSSNIYADKCKDKGESNSKINSTGKTRRMSVYYPPIGTAIEPIETKAMWNEETYGETALPLAITQAITAPATDVALLDKIFTISDLHSEFYGKNRELLFDLIPKLNAKFCILAGDIGSVMLQPALLEETLLEFKSRHQYVLMVPGNHEYYGSNYKFEEVNKKLAQICAKTGVILLNRGKVTIDGITFIGATLWSAIDEAGTKAINDFNHVFESKIDYLERFIGDYQYIRSELYKAVETDNKVVVVTHHLPSYSLIHPRFHNDPINTAFYSNVVSKLPMSRIKYWFCGHTHEFSKAKYGDAVLVCNPMGYPGEKRKSVLSTETYLI